MEKQLLDAIVASLEGDADGWVFSKYRATHRQTRTDIWVGSGRGGLHVNIGDSPPIGGVVVISIANWRYRLYAAVRSAIQRRQRAEYTKHWLAA